jgi:hypothetical protein
LTPRNRADLDRPRELPALLSDAVALYLRNLRVFLPIAALVVVPVDAAVLGLGLGQFSGHYDSARLTTVSVVDLVARLLVTGPLVTVMALHALTDLSKEQRPRLGSSIMAGLEAFRTVFWPVLVAFVAEAATLFLLLLGLVLFVRWYFVPQLVVVDRQRGLAPLNASWELTRGFALRTAGTVLVTNFLFQAVAGSLAGPLLSAAKSADSQALVVAYVTLSDLIIAVPIGLVASLLFFDIRARRRGRSTGTA